MTLVSKRPIRVYLDEMRDSALRRLAMEENASLSELIRRSIDLLLEEIPEEREAAYQIIGLGNSRVEDLGEHHDDDIAQEIEKESLG